MNVLTIAIILFCKQVAVAKVIFEVKFLKFENYWGQDSNGEGCDWITSCDHYFDISFSEASLIEYHRTGVYWNRNTVYFQSSAKNPIRMSFNKLPPGAINMNVNVYDRDDSNNDDAVAFLSKKMYVEPDASEKISFPTQTEMLTHGKRFTFQYRMYCEENFYGKDCSKECIARDDNINGHYHCSFNGNIVCLKGWENEENKCLDRQDDCEGHKCMNGARCQDSIRSYTCVCKQGFEGKYCETEINECGTNKCDNEGECIDEVGRFVCKCKAGFTGSTCSETACKSNSPCKNNGTCYGNLKCHCTDHFYGDHCTEPLCKKTGCKNGGVCTIHGYCTCPKGFVGVQCETVLCDILGPHCKNGAKCVEGKCQCQPNFKGALCDENVVCDNILCENGGICKLSYDLKKKSFSPSCDCLSGFYGKFCHIKETPEAKSNVNYDESNLNFGDQYKCDTIAFILYAFSALILLLLIIVFILIALVCKARRTRRKKPLHSILSTTTSIFSSDESARSLSASTMKSSLSHMTDGFVNQTLNKDNAINLSLENTQKSARPNVYTEEGNEKENNRSEIYEDLDDKVFFDKVDEDAGLKNNNQSI